MSDINNETFVRGSKEMTSLWLLLTSRDGNNVTDWQRHFSRKASQDGGEDYTKYEAMSWVS